MLSNNLSLDEEEAVQKELLELQQDIVRQRLSSSSNDPHNLQAVESEASLDIELPSIPSSKPIESPKEGQAFLNFYYFSLLHDNLRCRDQQSFGCRIIYRYHHHSAHGSRISSTCKVNFLKNTRI
jgi:hypothetical protein